MVGRTEDPPKQDETNRRAKDGRKNNGRRYPPRSNGYSDTHDYARRRDEYPGRDSRYRKDDARKDENRPNDHPNLDDIKKVADNTGAPKPDNGDNNGDYRRAEYRVENNGESRRGRNGHINGNYRNRNSNKPRFAKNFQQRSEEIKQKSKETNDKVKDGPKDGPKDVSKNVPKVKEEYLNSFIKTDKPSVSEPKKKSESAEKLSTADSPSNQPVTTSIIDELKLLGSTKIVPATSLKEEEKPPVKSPRQRTPSSSKLIEELKIIGEEMNDSKPGQVLEQLKSGENVELEILKELYDKIPDVSTEIVDSTTEQWVSSLVPLEAHSTPNVSTAQIDSGVESSPTPTRGLCCGCYPPGPMYHHGCVPPPHPAYYYPMWNIHHPLPPPPVQRLASAPSLPTDREGGFTHKRYITRSTKTPGTIVFTLYSTDNLRIVSVRCDSDFTMTADLCNEEGEKVAENFYLHSPHKPRLWEQYAFSGNHSLIFSLSSTTPTTVVVTFMHEITIK